MILKLKNCTTSKFCSQKLSAKSNICFILIYCMILGFSSLSAKLIKSHNKIEIQGLKQSLEIKKARYECLIGFQAENKEENINSLLSVQTQEQIKSQEFMKEQLLSQRKYCLIKKSIEGQNSQILFYSSNWEICKQKCCATISQDQCYFKASSHQLSIIQFNNPILSLRKLQQINTNSQKQPSDNPNQRSSQKQTLKKVNAEGNSTNADQDTTVGSQIVMIILLCIFGVPFTLLLFFAILSIVKLCRSVPTHTINTTNNPNPTETIIIQEINLDDYKMDQMGPYHINFQQKCPICLDETVNIRTHCGHYYHPQCIKAWLKKGKNRCPVCNCTRLNPIKVYCKKCSVGIKLVVLHGLVDDQFTTQIKNLICEDCVGDKESAFSPTPRKKSIDEKRRRNEKISSIKSESVGEEHNQNQIQSVGIRSSSNQLRDN